MSFRLCTKTRRFWLRKYLMLLNNSVSLFQLHISVACLLLIIVSPSLSPLLFPLGPKPLPNRIAIISPLLLITEMLLIKCTTIVFPKNNLFFWRSIWFLQQNCYKFPAFCTVNKPCRIPEAEGKPCSNVTACFTIFFHIL
jgi:hypothetical protein